MIENASEILAGGSRAEKIKLLAEIYPEAKSDLAESRRRMALVVKFCRDSRMGDAETWATLVVSTADEMKLDLATSEGMGVAAVLADYQLSENA